MPGETINTAPAGDSGKNEWEAMAEEVRVETSSQSVEDAGTGSADVDAISTTPNDNDALEKANQALQNAKKEATAAQLENTKAQEELIARLKAQRSADVADMVYTDDSSSDNAAKRAKMFQEGDF